MKLGVRDQDVMERWKQMTCWGDPQGKAITFTPLNTVVIKRIKC